MDDVSVEQPGDKEVVEEKIISRDFGCKGCYGFVFTWQFQAGAKETETLVPNASVGQDLSLTEDALEEAFALLSNRVKPSNDEPIFELPPKVKGVVRVGLLVPLSGKYAAFGTEIRRSIEMALFTFNNPNIEVLFL